MTANCQWNGQFSRFDLVAKTAERCRTVVHIRDLAIGGDSFVVMAGPCAVETEHQLLETAEAVAAAGAQVLRGGAYKPRSSPYSFQGLGVEGLKILSKARSETGLAIITEVMGEEDVDVVAEYTDIMQVGTRSMENYALLEALGSCGRPVLLKRGMTARLEELLQSAQVIAEAGNPDIILCERGIRTFETATGGRALVPIMARAAAVIGSDGLLIEVHPTPEKAWSDAAQTLSFEDFDEMMRDLRRYVSMAPAFEVTGPQLLVAGGAN